MPSVFEAALAAAEPIFDAHYGEDVTITPMRSTDFARVADPDRPAFVVSACVYEQDPSSVDIGRLEARIPYEEWEIEIRREVLAGRIIRKDDQITLANRAGGPVFDVARIDDTDIHRLRVTLARRKA